MTAQQSRWTVKGDTVVDENGEIVFTEDKNEDVRWRVTAKEEKDSLDYRDSYINVSGVDLKKFIKEVYNLSVPQGMGFIHFKEGALSDEDVEAILKRGNDRIVVSMDYVNGRACKMNVFKRPDGLFIAPKWFDHSSDLLTELLRRTTPVKLNPTAKRISI